MLVDLHAHYPMHLLADASQRVDDQIRAWARKRGRLPVLDLASRLATYPGPGDLPTVTESSMRAGNVTVALSVLYEPSCEVDVTRPYAAPPDPSYFDKIVAQWQLVENYATEHPSQVVIAHSSQELELLLDEDVPILIHAVEGGLQLGSEPAEIRRNVRVLGELGVVYVTVAHLFFRQIATNAPALPLLSDWLYNRAFPQPKDEGLIALGRELVQAMVDEGIIVDITHMRSESIRDVLALLDARDPDKKIPVIATHMACRFGGLQYCLDDDTIRAVAARGGLLGCTLSKHDITSGLRRQVTSVNESVEALSRHIDKVRDLTGSYNHVAIGSDFDGYITPSLPGLGDMASMPCLETALTDRYGAEIAEQICSGNALRLLRSAWARK